jgi:uncharacterized membrane protein YhaH (DUF805 family)
MSHPALEDWFSLNLRRNRKSYILALLSLYGVLAAVLTCLWIFMPTVIVWYAIMGVFILPAVIVTYTLSAQRLRDFGVTGWLALLWIPIGMLPDPWGGIVALAANIVLISVPGTRGPNRYGPDPLNSKHTSLA